MINICKFSLILVFLFTVSTSPAYAIETPVGNIALPYVENQNDREPGKKKARRESNQSASVSLPVVLPTATPTLIPVPEPVQTAPTPTQAPSPQNTDNDDDDDNNEQPVLVPASGINPPKDKDRPNNQDEEKETAGVLDTPIKDTQSNQLQPPVIVEKSNIESTPNSLKTNEKVSSPVAIIEEIIAPPLTSLMKVKGINYYKSETLPQTTTNFLLILSFSLFVSGLILLRIYDLKKVFTEMKEKVSNRSKNSEPYSIPRLGTQ